MPDDEPPALHHLRIITQKELRGLVPYTPQHILRLEKSGKFPRRVQLGENRIGWRLMDIEAWLLARTPIETYRADAGEPATV